MPACDVVDDARDAVLRQLDDGAVLGEHDRSLRRAPLSRASWACAASMRNSPCTGMTARGRSEADDRAQLLGASVPGDVHRRVVLVQHLGARLRAAG